MNLESLKCFCAIFEQGSFRAAAKALNRSQPAISQQIKSLETELGFTLIDRKHNALTPQGDLLYKHAREILQATESIQKELNDLHAKGIQTIRVGTSDTTAMYYLPHHIHAFTQAHPHTRLELVNRSSDAVTELVRSGDLDLGIVTLPTNTDNLNVNLLFHQRLALVVPENNPLKNLASITFKDLVEFPFLLLDVNTRTGRLLQACFKEHGFTPQVVLDSGSFEVIKRYIKEGVGISFLPVDILDAGERGLCILEFQNLPTINIGAIRRHGAYQSRAEQTLLEILQSANDSGG